MKERTFQNGIGSIKENVSLNVANFLSQFTRNQAIYQWEGTGSSKISTTEEIVLTLEGNFAIYEEKKLSNCKIIFTSQRAIISGIEVKGTLVASMVSREVEERRSSAYRPEKLMPQIIKGWDIVHNNLSKVEIVKTGEFYSLFFFQQEKRLYIINDVTSEEMTIVTSILSEDLNIEIIHSDFRIPISDILLLIGVGIILTIVGWIIIVLLF